MKPAPPVTRILVMPGNGSYCVNPIKFRFVAENGTLDILRKFCEVNGSKFGVFCLGRD